MSHDDFDREIRSHLELEEEELVADGLSPEDARDAARRQFGNVTRVKEVVHDMRRLAWLDELAQDLKLAVRQLRKAPGIAVLTIVTLAMGIAASTTIFSAADTILWHPLPFKDASRLVGLWGYNPADRSVSRSVSFTVLNRWQAKDEIFEGAYTYVPTGTVLTGPGDAVAVGGAAVSRGVFGALGVHPVVGRGFMASDFLPHAPAVVILSDALWRARYAAKPDLIGHSITLDEKPYTVVGVMPPGFVFPFDNTRIWFPFVVDRGQSAGGFAFGRLRAGVSLAQAQAFAEATTRNIADETVRNLKEVRVRPLVFQDLRTVAALRLLLAAVLMLLLMATANVANVRLAQAVHRDGEMAVRASLGASRGRLTRQVVTETALVAVCATGLSIVMSTWAIRGMAAAAPSILTFESLRPMAIDWRAFTFAVVVAVVVGTGVALMPVLRVRRGDVVKGFKGATATAGAHHVRARNLLLGGQLAMTLVLLVGAGLLGAGFVRLLHEDPGFDADRILGAAIVLPAARFRTKADTDRFFNTLRREAALLPGVESATVSLGIPPGLGFRQDSIEIDHSAAITSELLVAQGEIDDGFFATLGIPLEQGRTFNAGDNVTSPSVAIIGHGLAHRLWPDRSPLGHQFRWLPDDRWWTVVGVVGDVKNGGFQQPTGDSAIYYPREQPDGPQRFLYLAVRTAGNPMALRPTIEQLVHRLDPAVPVLEMETANQVIAGENARVRFATFLMIAFAAIALILALVGTYGAFWYAISERTRELGVRVALGATPRDIVSLVLATSARLAIVGLVVGLALTLAATRILRSLLFETSPTDPAVLAIVTAGFLAAVLFATWIPARRASRTNPAEALRDG